MRAQESALHVREMESFSSTPREVERERDSARERLSPLLFY